MMVSKEEAFARAHRVITGVIRSSDMKARFNLPLQVWDSTGELYGVMFQSDVRMGNQPCVVEVSFTLKFSATEEEIMERAIAAMDAVYHRLQVKIVPEKKATK